jgi:hypothetical protein
MVTMFIGYKEPCNVSLVEYLKPQLLDVSREASVIVTVLHSRSKLFLGSCLPDQNAMAG